MTAVAVVLPPGVDDPGRVSGGNRYDRRVCDGLRGCGWTVEELTAPGSWPHPDPGARAALGRTLDDLPDGAVVLVDGLIASAAAAVLVPRSARLRLVVLVHLPLGGAEVPAGEEEAVLGAARAVVATSGWTRDHLLAHYRLDPAAVHVARPGTDPAGAAPTSPSGGRLLCVAALTPIKGQDLLVEALAALTELPWTCRLVGPLDRDGEFVAALRRRVEAAGIADRVELPGVAAGAALEREYRTADVLVVPSRVETFGMVVPEALAAALPVVATAVGGLPEAVGCTPTGRPGLLVPGPDPAALAEALRCWLTDPELRARLRDAARLRRGTLPGWSETTERLGTVLAAVGGRP
ncbi:glycosyltransferase family 4 protein [Modestobacter sp. VKM Ac-2985]|uniref:glycosyltransferase family 4 protein n=1 Tax=Modestobacter sp. VKM Ac-2985 TaxID=3004139 RepID=UPI0022AB8E5B|nr:glycosyltransferase family 4 protein [Modestobacter sp. VKM Ac-2985]MCZ2836990.1 glycosyltransferase family 4 protein [Modestobacter sp. VKM Ac-2985]